MSDIGKKQELKSLCGYMSAYVARADICCVRGHMAPYTDACHYADTCCYLSPLHCTMPRTLQPPLSSHIARANPAGARNTAQRTLAPAPLTPFALVTACNGSWWPATGIARASAVLAAAPAQTYLPMVLTRKSSTLRVRRSVRGGACARRLSRTRSVDVLGAVRIGGAHLRHSRNDLTPCACVRPVDRCGWRRERVRQRLIDDAATLVPSRAACARR